MFAMAALPVSVITGTGADSERRYAIPAGDSINIDRQAEVILIRFQNTVYAFALSCPHENACCEVGAQRHHY